MNSEYLFVYGTLLKDFNSDMAHFLATHSEFVGTGYFNGRLYEVDWYPGAITSENPSEKVYGHIFKIFDTKMIFEVLDTYEGIGETSEYPNEYTRTLIKATLETGECLKTWVYMYNQPFQHLKRIDSGDFFSLEENA
ncbi:MAG: gamma-glutamylcyclotransferase [Flavobacteriales bacterium]|nr:gamma-glutamylcyclotransferase [Flavobacteriia bacterium]NCP07002.1 gamma-glutamylcyclotransferase [Flavobacteriales bacterium]PIV95056.1 MAG: gamma-glutamylcyclotransferase [Flavobacteriaceae bacterium CG17_big_fil_post_rev_8_21_14_2_50_33_15]PIY09280.1 MAG: gamma-glutamylcyclotransferase [Flavobacteriaceae bacterium CG_4_10_14_3_um_filter_33_47]PJB20254.1 MAG: gamma-glutamylcyclotransferase [Flavobacteriaceae bacterium CG_4_9_14_3_um_filter_33_16]